MNLEFLPNEIFLDLFGYFNGTDLLRAFDGLNSRFNLLLYKQFRSYRFRFDSISKRRFDVICQQHLPFIVDQVILLHLSDRRETPGQISLFLFYIPSLRQFTHLKSLTLSYLDSDEILLKLLDECQHLSHFTHLKFDYCSFPNSPAGSQLIMNRIWSLPKLTNFYFDMDVNGFHNICMPTVSSTSLECVTIYYGELQLSQLNRLFEYTPRLKCFSILINDSINDHYIVHPRPALLRYEICFVFLMDLTKMVILFQSMSNLRHLDVNTIYQLIYGHQWEEIIRNHLPKLKTFRLQMEESFYDNENIQEQAGNLLNSFRSSFWIDKHQWFVRCMTWNRTIHLETLSSISNYYTSMNPDSWQSTYPHDNQQEMYKNVTSFDSRDFDHPMSSNIRLPNINYLQIKLPINEQLWSIVPNLNQLKTLAISSRVNTSLSELQTLLDRAPHLQTLRIDPDASLPLQTSLFKYTNASVRQIDLSGYDLYLNEEECHLFARSPLAVQCEVLSIDVTNHQSIIYLVRNMPNLRSLTVKCLDVKYQKQSLFIKDNKELVQWLKDQLPSTVSIRRDAQNNRNILIWM